MYTKNSDSRLPRILATVLLLVSLLMFGLLLKFALGLAHGVATPARVWLFPLIILAAGAVMMALLAKRQIPLQLYAMALALWLLTSGYYLWTYFAPSR